MLRLVATALLCAGTLPGCLNRTIRVETRPAGARVLMDGRDIGRTPLEFEETYGGVREFLLLHEDGEVVYEPLRVRQDTSRLLYDTFPFDLFVAAVPTTIDDRQVYVFDLRRSKRAETWNAAPDAYANGLLKRAEQLRAQARELRLHGPAPRIEQSGPPAPQNPGASDADRSDTNQL